MKTRFSALFLAALAALPAVSARAGGDSQPFTPKTRSTFAAATDDAHNPFWPIGWIKTANVNPDAGAATGPAALTPVDFTVSTILLNDPPLAMINGKPMAEGEIATLPVAGGMVTVQLMAVKDGGVVLRWQNQTITVPLHRDEDLTKGDTVLGETAASNR